MPSDMNYDWSFSDAVSQLIQASELQKSGTKKASRQLASSSQPTSPSNEPERPHMCHFQGCTRSFGRLEHLKRHIRSHTGERPFSCTFAGCQKRFSRFDNMLQHARCHTEKATRRRKRTARDSRRDERVAKYIRSSGFGDREVPQSHSEDDDSHSDFDSNVASPNHTFPHDMKLIDGSFREHHSSIHYCAQTVPQIPVCTYDSIPAEYPSLPSLPRPPLVDHVYSLPLAPVQPTSSIDSYFLDKLRAASTLASFAFSSLPNELLSGKPALLC